MNSTSFTSIDPNCAISNDKNIDSSSTAHLTLNAAIGSSGGGSGGVAGSDGGAFSSCRLTRGSNSSDPDASPSVTVLTSSSGNGNGNSNNHHHHLNAHSLPRPSHLLSSGFSFSNRLHLTTKHQRTLWSRATHFEKILMLTLLVLCTISVILFVSLASIIVRQRSQLRELKESNHPEAQDVNATKKYCLTQDCVKVAASVIEAIDSSVDPCDDFYVSAHLAAQIVDERASERADLLDTITSL